MASDATEIPTDDGPVRLPQEVEVADAGPCKKHIKVTIGREIIDERIDAKVTELTDSEEQQVRGFRPGKVPRRLIEQRFAKQIREQVRNEVLMASLQQMHEEEEQFSPLSPPDLDPYSVELPDQGPLVYEFDIEVRPEFNLPEYKGMKLRKPVKEFTDAEVQREKRRLLSDRAQIVPKEGGAVELDDVLVADITFQDGDKVLNEVKEARVNVDNRLVFSNGSAEKFFKEVEGAKPGETRDVTVTLTGADGSSRNIQAKFAIQDLKTLRLPEMQEDDYAEYGVADNEGLEELIRVALERRLTYLQRQEARKQILQKIDEASQWELPEDMLKKQAQRTLSRRIMEMRNGGLSDQEISSRMKVLQQDVIRSTAASLKEHFVLQRIAELEEIEIEEKDIDEEIDRLAEENDESPRRVRARLEKDDLIETLAAELLERRALDLVLEAAEYEEYPLNPEEDEGEAATLDAEAALAATPADAESGDDAEDQS